MKKILSLSLVAVAATAMVAPQASAVQRQQVAKENRFSISQVSAPAKFSKKIDATKAGNKITVKDGEVTPFYVMPHDAFRSAFFLSEGSFSYFGATLVAPSVPVTFTNKTIGGGDNFKWSFYNANLSTDSLSIYNGRDLTTTFNRDCAGLWASPRLYTTDDINYYAMEGGLRYGGALELTSGDIKTTLSNYDPSASYNNISLVLSSYAGKQSGWYVPWYDFYNDILSKQTGAASAEVISIMHHFDAPARPYAFSRVNLIASVTGQAGQTLTCKIVSPNSHGDIEGVKPIATAQYVLPSDASDETLSIDFNFVNNEEDWVIIDSEIYVMIEGVKDFDLFAPYVVAANEEFYNNYLSSESKQGFCKWQLYDENDMPIFETVVDCSGGYAWGLSEDDMTVGTHFALGINAQYDYIAADDAQETEVLTYDEGGTTQVTVEASEVFNNWNIQSDATWFTLEGTDVIKTDEETGEYFAGIVDLNVNADPLPEGISYREATVTVSLKTQTLTLKVKQGGEVPPSPFIVGDVNGDGLVNVTDINVLVNITLGSDSADNYDGRADVNNDGKINISDINALLNIIM